MLEKREIRRVGGSQVIPVDVRIVAATNRDLVREVNRNTFREDLYYRLAVVRVRVPPLREREGDVPLLVEHFVRESLDGDEAATKEAIASITEENWKRLMSHPWPGNVRELRNFIERTMAITGGVDVDERAGVGARPQSGAATVGPATLAGAAIDLARPFIEAREELLAHFEKGYLEAQLARHGGNISRAARAAGLDRMHFKRLLARHQRARRRIIHREMGSVLPLVCGARGAPAQLQHQRRRPACARSSLDEVGAHAHRARSASSSSADSYEPALQAPERVADVLPVDVADDVAAARVRRRRAPPCNALVRGRVATAMATRRAASLRHCPSMRCGRPSAKLDTVAVVGGQRRRHRRMSAQANARDARLLETGRALAVAGGRPVDDERGSAHASLAGSPSMTLPAGRSGRSGRPEYSCIDPCDAP